MAPDLKMIFIGSGNIMRSLYLPTCSGTSGLRPAAIFGRKISKLKKLAKQYSIPLVYQNPEKLFREVVADVCVIALPPSLHAAFAETALKSGMHVLLEKPAFCDIDEGKKLEALTKETGRFVQINMTLRFLPVVRAMKKAVTESLEAPIQGNLSYLTSPPSQKWYYAKQSAGGGAAINIGIHAVDLVCHLLGKDIRKIEFIFMKHKWRWLALEDEAGFNAYFSETIKCQFGISRLHKGFSVKLTLKDRKNTLGLSLTGNNAEISLNGNAIYCSNNLWGNNLSDNALTNLADCIRGKSGLISGLEEHITVLTPLLESYSGYLAR